MALETTDSLPRLEEFALLSEHQQQTPSSFFGGKPVLYLRCPAAKVKISSEDLAGQPAIAQLRSETLSPEEVGEPEEQVTIENLDIWVTSSSLILVSTTKALAIEISFPTITIHAQDGEAVLLGLNLSDTNTADEDQVFIQLRIFPSSIEKHEHEEGADTRDHHPNGNGVEPASPAKALFKAIADCQELNPDPPDGEAEDGEFDETAPGATGWITSENMGDFMDENGEFKMPEGLTVIGGPDEASGALGEGAGRTRSAAEIDAEDGAGEDGKWQRTG